MRNDGRRRVLAAALAVGLGLAGTGGAGGGVAGASGAGTGSGSATGSTASAGLTAQAQAQATPLRILLTNDDGFAAPGIRAIRDGLVAAGHEVTIVAPATDQSGSSGKVTFSFGSTIQLVEQEPGIFSVAGTPADSVLVGLATVFAENPPDLVVSGTNIGQNSGGLVGHSGTVGAAVTAVEESVPAIAVSTEIDLAAGTGATIERFDDTAQFLVRLIGTLQTSARSGDPLLPAGQALNVNFPVVTEGDLLPDGVAFTQVGKWSFVEPTYRPAGPNTFVIVPTFPPFDEPVPQADTTALRQDKVSISVLDGNLGLNPLLAIRVFVRLFPLLRP